jgi:uncharacterized protein YjhX (UPF0386 family)
VRSGADRAQQCGSLGLIGAGMPRRSPLSTMGTFRNLSEVTADATAAIRCYERNGWRHIGNDVANWRRVIRRMDRCFTCLSYRVKRTDRVKKGTA